MLTDRRRRKKKKKKEEEEERRRRRKKKETDAIEDPAPLRGQGKNGNETEQSNDDVASLSTSQTIELAPKEKFK